MRATVGAGTGVAAVWSVPSLRTVRPLQAAGSPPPPTSTTTVETPVTVAGVTTSTSTTTSVPAGTQGAPAAPTTTTTDPGAVTDPLDSGSGSLPFTGTEAVELALFGTAAVLGGRALLVARGRNAPPGGDDKYLPSGDEP